MICLGFRCVANGRCKSTWPTRRRVFGSRANHPEGNIYRLESRNADIVITIILLNVNYHMNSHLAVSISIQQSQPSIYKIQIILYHKGLIHTCICIHTNRVKTGRYWYDPCVWNSPMGRFESKNATVSSRYSYTANCVYACNDASHQNHILMKTEPELVNGRGLSCTTLS